MFVCFIGTFLYAYTVLRATQMQELQHMRPLNENVESLLRFRTLPLHRITKINRWKFAT